MKILPYGWLLLAFMTMGTAQADLANIEGWRLDSEINSYPPDKLWEVINGAAEQYLAYDVQEVRSCDLAARDLAVSVMIFEMKSPLEAFGIYRVECPTGGETLAIGTTACLAAPYQGVMLKDRYYVKVDAYEGELNSESGGDLLTALAEMLPGKAELPPELNQLPEAGRVPGSAGYVAQGYLGLNELNRCLHVSYAQETGEPYQVFLLFPDPGETVASTWSSLAEKWPTVTYEDRPVLTKQVPYRGLVGVFLTKQGIVGAAGVENQEQLFAIVSTWQAPPAEGN